MNATELANELGKRYKEAIHEKRGNVGARIIGFGIEFFDQIEKTDLRALCIKARIPKVYRKEIKLGGKLSQHFTKR